MRLNLGQRGNTLRTVTTVFFAFVLLLLIISAGVQIVFAEKTYPRTYLGSLDIGSLTLEEVQNRLQEHWARVSNEGFEFYVGDQRSIISPYVTAPGNPDQTYDLVDWNIEEEAQYILASKKSGGILGKILQPLRHLATTTHLETRYTIVNEEGIQEVLRENFGEAEKETVNSSFVFYNGETKVSPAKTGLKINYDSGLGQIKENLKHLESKAIHLEIEQDIPEITLNDALPLISEFNRVVTRAPFKLLIDDDKHVLEKIISQDDVRKWVVPISVDGDVMLGFHDDARAYLETFASEINKEPLDAKFEIGKTGKLDRFQTSREGQTLDIDMSLALMTENLIRLGRPTSSLSLIKTKPQVETRDANNLGISELIGSGSSDFSGSPKNRRINIQVSSDKLNGLLIPPGEEFSLVETLKPFTSAAGYVAELVIKGSRLIPEIGGGACQIGTTVFRTALDSGLEITQRRNHSFAVSYYNDENGLPGTDATIYDPAPDFRFRNNTGSHILIQTFVGDDDILTYEFWGTSDGRKASTTIPVILSKVSPPATKYIETEDLEPGVTECSGSNVPGYKTTFKYSVLNAQGEYESRNFDSNYRPFQRVCLIGVSPLLDKEGQGEVNPL